MTVSSSASTASFPGNGVTTVFPLPFRFFSNSDVEVSLLNVASGVVTPQSIGTNYTLSGAGDPEVDGNANSTLTMLVAPPSGVTLIVERVMDAVQQTDIINQARFFPEIHENVFDRLTMLIQQALGISSRALLKPIGKNYFDALGLQIKNVQNPTDPQDAATQASVSQQIADLLQIGSGSANNAANVLYVPNPSGQIPRTVQSRLRDMVSVLDYIDTPVDGVTSNQNGIVAAVSAANALGADLWWPTGVYVSDSSIPGFHNCRHYGPGVIKRGIYSFRVRPRAKATTTNYIFADPAGDDAYDGLTPDFPKGTLQGTFNCLQNMGDELGGFWRVELAGATFNQSGTLDGVKFRNRLVIAGRPRSAGSLATLVNGAGISTSFLAGITLSNGIYAQVNSIHFINWTGASGVGSGDANTGLTVVDKSNVWSDDCDFTSCGTGLGATNCRIYQGRGNVTNCSIGSTAFASTQCSYGYGGATTYTGCLAVAVNIRDSSSGVVDAGVFVNNNIGVRVQYGSVCRISNSAFSGSTVADCYGYTGAAPFFGDGNTYTPGKQFKAQFAIDLGNASQFYFDLDRSLGLAAGRGAWNLGLDAATPNYRWHFRDRSQLAFAPAASHLVIEHETPQIGLSGPATAVSGLNVAIPGVPLEAYWQYSAVDKEWRMRNNNADTYRMSAATLRPAVDGGPSLGTASFKFSVVYAATGTINTSDEHYKRQIRPIDEAALRAWAKVEYMQYKMADAVEEKGDSARWHFGLIAQRVQEAFESEGLNAMDYGLLCYDEWEETPFEPAVYGPEIPATEERQATYDEMGIMLTPYMPACPGSGGPVLEKAEVPYRPAGSRYGIRYEEALALECAYLRAKMEGRI